MNAKTLFKYLLGNRQAILAIAGDRRALLTGGLFVLSAGLARNYDTRYLPEEPWALCMPFAASLLTSSIMYLVLWTLCARKIEDGPGFVTGYRSFLSLYWMTAPMAWLYGIPYERFMDPYAAVVANLWTLGIVSVWRIALITRVVSVLLGIRYRLAFFMVMVVADGAVVLVAGFSAFELLKSGIGNMAGIRDIPMADMPSDVLLRRIVNTVGLGSLYSSIIWIIGAVVAGIRSAPSWNVPDHVQLPLLSRPRVGVLLPCFAIGFWCFFLPSTQREQKLAWTVNGLMERGVIREALQLMSDHSVNDFPPHFNPGPRYWSASLWSASSNKPDILQVVEAIVESPPAPWVREIYVAKLQWGLSRWFHPLELHEECNSMIRVTNILSALREGPKFAAAMQKEIQTQLNHKSFDDNPVCKYGLLTLLYLAVGNANAHDMNLPGFDRDYTEAIKWHQYRTAAEKGDVGAQFALAMMYYSPTWISPDFVEARKWYDKAAEQGHADAQYKLGLMIENGEGGGRDYAEATKWYRKSADNGDEQAKEKLHELQPP